MKKKIIYLVLIFFILISSLFIIKKLSKKDDPKIYFPGLQIKDISGNLINMSKFYGKPLVINFWATWCGPCREELPYFESNYKKYGDRVNFLMISGETFEIIKAFKDSNKYSMPIVQSQKQLNELKITTIPFTTIYSAQGKFLATISTPLNEAELSKIIIDLIQ